MYAKECMVPECMVQLRLIDILRNCYTYWYTYRHKFICVNSRIEGSGIHGSMNIIFYLRNLLCITIKLKPPLCR